MLCDGEPVRVPMGTGQVDGDARVVANARNVLVAEAGAVFAFAPHRTQPSHGTGAGDGAISAPIPGKVTAVGVTMGESVAAGTVVIVLEAMKMEYTLTAPFDGSVAEINCTLGDQVVEGTVLVRIEEDQG